MSLNRCNREHTLTQRDHNPLAGLSSEDRSILEYYEFCRENGRPYFGPIMWASQGLPLRHVAMQELIRFESSRAGTRRFDILEVGSWAGGSAITWAEALARHHRRQGRVVCVDPWKPYFDPAKRPDAPVYRAMSAALLNDTIYDLFLHNVSSAGYDDIVVARRGDSGATLPMLPRRAFDVVFIDGDHSYAAVRRDLEATFELVRDGGILCGDDLELQLSEIDIGYARTQLEADYIRDPATGKEYHPGVTLAVGELLGTVSNLVGFWAVRREGARWSPVDFSQFVCGQERIPMHLRTRGAGDPVFEDWRRRRRQGFAGGQIKLQPAVERDADTVKPKVLLVQLEFSKWAQAKAWSYVGNFAVEDGLRANGCECVTLPVFCDVPDNSPSSWLHHAKDLLAGQRFDQVWVWLVHNRYSEACLEWIAELAPVRVGVIMESLRYSEDDCLRWSHLRERARFVERQLNYMTHALVADEHDADLLNQTGLVQALFWPAAVPARFITATIERPSRREAVFHGELYGGWPSPPPSQGGRGP